MHNKIYSKEFKEQALVKVYSRQSRTIESIADELNMLKGTLKMWMRDAVKNTLSLTSNMTQLESKRPEDWSLEERLVVLQKSYGLTDDALNSLCREQGIYVHHLTKWKADFCTANALKVDQKNTQELRKLKQDNAILQRDLNRKEKALVEAATLLVLQKKFNALWEDEEK